MRQDSIRHPCGGDEGRCGVLVARGRCQEHARQEDLRRGSFRQRHGGLYDARWDKRKLAFRRKHPFCGNRPNGLRPVMSACFDEGRTTAAYQTDHVVPHRGDLVLFWDEANNWQSLCASCGARKSRAGL